MDKQFSSHQFSLKSNIFNALFLQFIHQIIFNLLWFSPLLLLYFLAEYIFKLEYQNEAIFFVLVLTLLYSILKISKKLFIILITIYNFTSSTIEKQSGFISKQSHSIHYSQITDIELSQTLWDRVCNVGDLVVHTANDGYVDKSIKGSMILKDIKNPKQLKQTMFVRMSESKHHTSLPQHQHDSHSNNNHSQKHQ